MHRLYTLYFSDESIDLLNFQYIEIFPKDEKYIPIMRDDNSRRSTAKSRFDRPHFCFAKLHASVVSSELAAPLFLHQHIVPIYCILSRQQAILKRARACLARAPVVPEAEDELAPSLVSKEADLADDFFLAAAPSTQVRACSYVYAQYVLVFRKDLCSRRLSLTRRKRL